MFEQKGAIVTVEPAPFSLIQSGGAAAALQNVATITGLVSPSNGAPS